VDFELELDRMRICDRGIVMDPTVKLNSQAVRALHRTFVHFVPAGAPMLQAAPQFPLEYSPPVAFSLLQRPVLHILKVDCEGCEYAIARDVLATDAKFFESVMQLAIEVHVDLRFLKSAEHLNALDRLLKLISDAGLRLAHAHMSGCGIEKPSRLHRHGLSLAMPDAPDRLHRPCLPLLESAAGFPCRLTCQNWLFVRRHQPHGPGAEDQRATDEQVNEKREQTRPIRRRSWWSRAFGSERKSKQPGARRECEALSFAPPQLAVVLVDIRPPPQSISDRTGHLIRQIRRTFPDQLRALTLWTAPNCTLPPKMDSLLCAPNALRTMPPVAGHAGDRQHGYIGRVYALLHSPHPQRFVLSLDSDSWPCPGWRPWLLAALVRGADVVWTGAPCNGTRPCFGGYAKGRTIAPDTAVSPALRGEGAAARRAQYARFGERNAGTLFAVRRSPDVDAFLTDALSIHKAQRDAKLAHHDQPALREAFFLHHDVLREHLAHPAFACREYLQSETADYQCRCPCDCSSCRFVHQKYHFKACAALAATNQSVVKAPSRSPQQWRKVARRWQSRFEATAVDENWGWYHRERADGTQRTVGWVDHSTFA